MSTTTTNFGWTVPSDTDLVKDGAAAIRTALGGVDTSFVDLKGGTTGQILSKASGTDLDYTWIDQNTGDITGVTAGTGISGGGTSGTVTVTNSMATAIDAKGDLIAGTGADAFARLGVGSNGQVLTADSGETTGLKWATASSGGETLLSTTTLSGASTTISVSGGYNDLKIVVYGMTCGSNGYLTLKPNNSSSLAYYYTAYQNGASAAGPEVKNGSTWDLDQGYSYLANDANNVNHIYITNYAATDSLKPATSYGMHIGAGSQNVSYFATGAIKTSSAITSLVFSNSGGNFTAGTVLVYGVK
jgi:hypothetical protein